MSPRQYKNIVYSQKYLPKNHVSDRGIDLVGLLVGHGGGERQRGGRDRPDHQDKTVFFPSFRC